MASAFEPNNVQESFATTCLSGYRPGESSLFGTSLSAADESTHAASCNDILEADEGINRYHIFT